MYLLNETPDEQRWPHGMQPVVVLPKLDATIDRFGTLVLSRFEQLEASMDRRTKTSNAVSYATALTRRICRLTADPTFIDETRVDLTATGIIDAVQRHDNAVLFDWLIQALSYQGVSDAVASGYMEEHGCVTASEIDAGMQRTKLCPKLRSYWHFEDCGYRKWIGSCSMPKQYRRCPVPAHDMRNGRLNQTAYSLYLFMRDIAQDDLVSWIDRRLEAADGPTHNRPARLAAAVLEPFTHIYGVSDKVVSMSLAGLLLAGDHDRERWRTAGGAMIAIDTLVHNWMHRTGILDRFNSRHLYGPHCYRASSCADIVRLVSARIDARRFNPDFPKDFPRLVQHAIWSFCAQSGLDICNGNQIDDRKHCELKHCPLYGRCGRMALQQPGPSPALN